MSDSTETDTTTAEDQTDDSSAEREESTNESGDSSSESDGDPDEGDGTQLTKEQAMGSEDVPEDKQKAIEEERQERLAPDNRPDGAQIDNSEREFDMGTGQFTDHETDEEIGPYNDPSAPDGEIEA